MRLEVTENNLIFSHPCPLTPEIYPQTAWVLWPCVKDSGDREMGCGQGTGCHGAVEGGCLAQRSAVHPPQSTQPVCPVVSWMLRPELQRCVPWSSGWGGQSFREKHAKVLIPGVLLTGAVTHACCFMSLDFVFLIYEMGVLILTSRASVIMNENDTAAGALLVKCAGCVTWDGSLALSGPCFPHL